MYYNPDCREHPLAKTKWSYLHFYSIYFFFTFVISFPFIVIFLNSNFLRLFIAGHFYYTLQGVYRNHSVRPSICFFCLFVCLCRFVSGPYICFSLTFDHHSWYMVVSPWDNMSHTFMIAIRCWLLTPGSNLNGFWQVLMSDQSSFQIISCFCIPPVPTFCFDIGIPYLTHGSITMRVCVLYIYDSWYDIDLWPQGKIYRVHDMALCSRHRFFVLSHSHTMWVYHHGTMCSVHPWPLYDLDLWSQYFHHEFETGKIVIALWHTKFWHMLYHRETTCCVHSSLSMTLIFYLDVGDRGGDPFWVLLTSF